ncbi:MAG: hypothetical protein ABI327_14545 [Burkholderiaceae bacterium]
MRVERNACDHACPELHRHPYAAERTSEGNLPILSIGQSLLRDIDRLIAPSRGARMQVIESTVRTCDTLVACDAIPAIHGGGGPAEHAERTTRSSHAAGHCDVLALFERVSDDVVFIDAAGGMLSCNDRTTAAIGIPTSDLC